MQNQSGGGSSPGDVGCHAVGCQGGYEQELVIVKMQKSKKARAVRVDVKEELKLL